MKGEEYLKYFRKLSWGCPDQKKTTKTKSNEIIFLQLRKRKKFSKNFGLHKEIKNSIQRYTLFSDAWQRDLKNWIFKILHDMSQKIQDWSKIYLLHKFLRIIRGVRKTKIWGNVIYKIDWNTGCLKNSKKMFKFISSIREEVHGRSSKSFEKCTSVRDH